MNWRIKLHRKFIEREWYDDPNTKILFLHLLLKASHKEIKWKWQIIKTGQCITGRIALSKETWLTQQQVRRSLLCLKTTSEITIKTTNKFSLITICRRSEYQSEEKKQPAKQPANEPTNNHIQEDKEIKNNTYMSELKEFVDRRNNVKPFWLAQKGLPKTLKISDKIERAWRSVRKEYSFDEVLEWVNKYCKYMDKVKPKYDWDTYYEHRFWMLQFLKQANWLEKFFNT